MFSLLYQLNAEISQQPWMIYIYYFNVHHRNPIILHCFIFYSTFIDFDVLDHHFIPNFRLLYEPPTNAICYFKHLLDMISSYGQSNSAYMAVGLDDFISSIFSTIGISKRGSYMKSKLSDWCSLLSGTNNHKPVWEVFSVWNIIYQYLTLYSVIRAHLYNARTRLLNPTIG